MNAIRAVLESVLRSVSRHPVRTGFLVVTLAFGSASITTAFSVARDAILGAAPFPEADRLVWVGVANSRSADDGLSLPLIREITQRSKGLRVVAAFTRRILQQGGDETSLPLEVTAVTGDFFDVLQVTPFSGRVLGRGDDQRGSPRAVVVSYSFWRSSLHSSTSVSGWTLRIARNSYDVVGVMPRDFAFPDRQTDVWLPMHHVLPEFVDAPGIGIAWSIARLAPGATLRSAAAEVSSIFRDADSRASDGGQLFLSPLRDWVTRDIRPRVRLLIGAALLVLILALGTNVNLLIGRHIAGQHETSIRIALGEPSSWQLASAIGECAVYSVGGGALGSVLAFIALWSVLRAVPEGTPEFSSMTLKPSVFLAAAVASLGTLLVLPISLLARPRTDEDHARLRSGFGARTEHRSSRQVRDALLALEIGSTLVLLVSAVALVRSYFDLANSDLGFRTAGLAAASVSLPITVLTPENRGLTIEYFRRTREELQQTPGFAAVAFTTEMPASGNRMVAALSNAVGTDSLIVGVVGVTPGFFALLGMPLLQGRGFGDDDDRSAAGAAEHPVVIDEIAAARIFGGATPLGQTAFLRELAMTVRVVGVVRNIHQNPVGEPTRSQAYLPFSAMPLPWSTVVVQTNLPGAVVRETLKHAGRNAVSEQNVGVVRQLRSIVDDRLDRSRVYALLLSSAAVLAVLLTGTGLYGVTSMRVASQAKELAIRASLGATPRSLFLRVVTQTLVVAAVGVGLGILALVVADPTLTRVLYGMSPLDFDALILSTALVLSIVVCATLRPAWVAATSDPNHAMRTNE